MAHVGPLLYGVPLVSALPARWTTSAPARSTTSAPLGAGLRPSRSGRLLTLESTPGFTLPS